MEHVINFLDAMIEQPLRTFQRNGEHCFSLSEDQREGFKIACELIKEMIEGNYGFKQVNDEEA